MKTKKSIIISLSLLFGVIILFTILSNTYYFRADLTSDKQYTLSKATRQLLLNLKEPVTVKAYFTKDMPQEMGFSKAYKDFKELLIEFSALSKGRIEYEFIDPNEEEDIEREIQMKGIFPRVIDVREKNKAVQKKVYLGAVVYLGEKSDIIPFIAPGSAMEYTLFRSIKRISVTEKPIVGLLQGHGEPSRYMLSQAMEELSVLYEIKDIYLHDSIDKLEGINILAIIAPKDTFPETHLNQLERFIAEGNNLFIAYNKVEGDLNTGGGQSIYTGLEDWLKSKGIVIDDNFVVDVSCGSVGIPQQVGPLTFTSNVDFYFVPIITNFSDHPITSGIEAVGMMYASTIDYIGDTNIVYTPLVFTSDMSGIRPSPASFDIAREWSESDFPLSKLTIGASFEGNFSGGNDAKLVVFTDGDFPVNSQGRNSQINPDNVNLLVNAIDYLSGHTTLIELRTKGVTSRPLEQIEDNKKTLLKWLNFALPISYV